MVDPDCLTWEMYLLHFNYIAVLCNETSLFLYSWLYTLEIYHATSFHLVVVLLLVYV